MDSGSNAPIIIKRKKVVSGDGHHGGAWKVAYADFVTAMMAFFMLMWLLNATTEQQRKGIADYFAPTIPINRISGGGDGALGGNDIFSLDMLAQSGTGGLSDTQGDAAAEAVALERAREEQAMRDLEEALLGLGGESVLSDNALRHIVTRLTDEGLVIELFDVDDVALFQGDTAEAAPVLTEIAAILSRILGVVENDLAVTGHVRAQSFLRIDYPVWTLSHDRANALRDLLEEAGSPAEKFLRVTAKADREPIVSDTQAIRNNRIELIVLRSDQPDAR